ncbi:MAG: tetratricopeptide repeat protein [Gemmatimonadota bacterium]
MLRPAFRITAVTVAGIVLILYLDGQSEPVALTPHGSQAPAFASATGAAGWFQGVRPRCNAVEVETALRSTPAPSGWEGRGFEAACLALAGRTEAARTRIAGLSGDERWRAAGIVFDVGHPVADAGDDVSAAPIMELVVEFWPNHYMALYHAGAARTALGEAEAARPLLEAFLREYPGQDGWTRSAERMLER